MFDWPIVPLSRLAEIRISNVNKKATVGEIAVRLCNYMDAYENDYITGRLEFMEASATRSEIERFQVRLGDVVLTKDSETPDDIGIPAVLTENITNLICGYHLALIRPDSELVNSIYLAKQLGANSVVAYYSRLANGSTRYGLSYSAIASTPVLLASPTEQRRIAEILSTLDEIIKQTEALIAKYQQIKAGLMHDLFTRGLTPDGRLRPTRAEAPHLYKQSPLGWIPNDWKSAKLSAVCKTASGGTPSRAEPAFWNGDIPWVKTGEIRYRLIEDTEEKISRLGLRYSATTLVSKGSVIMALFGQGPTRGRVAILGVDATLNQACLAFVPTNGVSNTYLFYALTCAYKKLRALSNDGAQQNLNASLVRNFSIPIANSHEQDFIVRSLESLWSSIAQEEQSLHKLRQLKLGLMQDLLTGRVRVPIPELTTA